MSLKTFVPHSIKKYLYLFCICILPVCLIYQNISYAGECQNSFSNPSKRFMRDLQKGEYDESNHFVTTRSLTNVDSKAPFLGRIIQKTGEDTLLIERIYEPSGKFRAYVHRVRTTPKKGSHYFISDSPINQIIRGDPRQLKLIHTALRSTRQKVSHEDIKLSTIKEEQALKDNGFNSFYTRGLDEVYKNISLANQLRKLEVNPYTTHIESLAEAALSHIEFMSRGIDINTKEGLEQKKALDILKRRAKRAIKNETVTYKWWLRFNYALSAIFSKGNKLNRHQLEYIDKFIPHFPASILVPTTIGEMGIIALNKAASEGVLMIGLINKEKRVHNRSFKPIEFFVHDLEHSAVLMGLNYMDANVTHKQFYDKLVAEIENLPTKKRKDVELIHFTLMREFALHPTVDHPERGSIANMVEALFRMDMKDFSLSANFGETIGMIDNYLEVYNKIKNYFNLKE